MYPREQRVSGEAFDSMRREIVLGEKFTSRKTSMTYLLCFQIRILRIQSEPYDIALPSVTN